MLSWLRFFYCFVDFVNVSKHTSDILYPHAEKIVLVTYNLNTHVPASLYKAFSSEEAHSNANRFEWHYTPKHASWLDMAEIEIGIMSRQALAKPLPDFKSFKSSVEALISSDSLIYPRMNYYACVYNCDMIISWNFKHMVNINHYRPPF